MFDDVSSARFENDVHTIPNDLETNSNDFETNSNDSYPLETPRRVRGARAEGRAEGAAGRGGGGRHAAERAADIAAVRGGRAERGVLVCGTGVGACIAGNKVPGIRAAVCHDLYSAHQCVEHDDVNVLCLGAQIVGVKLAEEILAAYLRAQFSTEDHFRRRVAKLGEMERAAARELGGGGGG